MNKHLTVILVATTSLFSAATWAAQGEYWEVTTKMEMPGMPFAMPGRTSKLCLPKGGESDPRNTQGKDSNCKMTDVKQSGNTVKFKGTCNNEGETMNMAGETSHDSNSFKSNMKMTGKSHGEPVDMTMTSSGKRIGGSCDTEEAGKKAKAQIDAGMAAACDTSHFKAYNWVSSSSLFLGSQPTCPGKKDTLCQVLRNDVPHDLQAFEALVQQEQRAGMPSAAKACNVNVEAMKKSLCKAKAHSGPQYFLDANCPAEAKAFRELMRKREECAGRGYTSGDKMKSCMGGEMIEEEASSPGVETKKSKPGKAKANEGQNNYAAPENESSSSGDMLEGAKKLKGMFGF